MIRHRSPISGVACFGTKYVATAGYDGQVILWNAESHEAIARGRHDHLGNQCAFSRCGNHLVSSGADFTARLWRLPEMRLVSVMPHDDDVEVSLFSPDGQRILTSSRDRCVRIFTLDGRLEHKLVGHQAAVLAIDWFPDGREVISSSDDGDLRRWNAQTGELIEQVALGGVQVDAMALGPNRTIFAGNDDGDIFIIKDDCVRKVHAHASGIKGLSYDAAQRILLSTGYDGFVRLWRAQVHADTNEVSLENAGEVAASVSAWLRAYAMDSRGRIVVGTFGSTYATFDVETKQWNFDGMSETPGVNGVCFERGSVWTVGDAGIVRRDGHEVCHTGSLCNFLVASRGRILTGGQTGELFDAETGSVLFKNSSPINTGIRIHQNGEERVILGTYSGDALVFSLRADELVLERRLPLFHSAIKGLAFNGELLFATCSNYMVGSARVSDWEILPPVERAHDEIVNGAAVLADGRFVSVSRDLSMRIWRGSESTRFETPHRHSVRAVAACPRTDILATGAYDGTVGLFDARSSRWLKLERPSDFGISSICAAETSGVFLASSYDGCVYEISASAAPKVRVASLAA